MFFNTVKEKFNKTVNPAQKQNKHVYKLDKKPAYQIENKQEMNVQTGYILIGFKGCNDISSKDSYALDVLATILGDGKSSRLYKHVKEQKQLVHSISSSHSSMRDDSIFYISSNYLTDDIPRLKEAIFSEIEKLQKNEITEEEIQKAKNIIVFLISVFIRCFSYGKYIISFWLSGLYFIFIISPFLSFVL